MDRFQEMQIFVRITERRSFTKAAEDLQLPRATVTNAITRLEERIGARLLNRTTRQVTPTLDGDAYYARCVRLLADVEEADGAFRNTAPKGLLRVSLQGTLARHFVIPALPAFLQRYPELELRIDEGDRFVDLVREGVDCVLRAGNLQDSSLIGRRVALLEQVTCASAAYVARHGLPGNLAELAGHKAVNYVSSATGKLYPLEFTVNGSVQFVTLPGDVCVSGADMYAECARAGLGLIQVPRYRLQGEIESGALREILPDFPPPTMPVTVLYPQNRQLSARVRVFAEWLKDLFAQ
ncbi:LysR family transcriptional regulator [Herminiimonas fonticola]|uniref:LysR family transcriptional regulator n=1 Tax=Herminiimonas fonticola TaxID=303380 RepID=UPI00333ED216